jgi:cell wall-associated NlpC family hydrolase
VPNRLVSRIQLRRAAVFATALAVAGGFAVYTGVSDASAAATPSVATVQKEVNSLQGQVDKLGEEYDASSQELATAQADLKLANTQSGTAQQQYEAASQKLAAVAVSQYENSDATSIAGLLSTGDPSAVLAQASQVLQLEGANNEEAQQLLAMANNVDAVKTQRQRKEETVAQLQQQEKQQLAASNAALSKAQSLLSSLNAQEEAQVATIDEGGNGGGVVANAIITPQAYTGTTATENGKAVAYVLSKLGDEYVWGDTGPDAFDCSGLMYAAYLSAGITLPRTTEEEWADLPHVSLSDLVPGDMILYNGESHVAMYVGNGMIVDAPHTGAVVEEIPMDTDWYAENEDGAVEP